MRRNHVCADSALAVDDGQCRFVAAALDGQHQRGSRLKRRLHFGRALAGNNGPRAHRRARLGPLAHARHVHHQRKRRRHDQSIVAGAIVAATTSHLLKAQALIQPAGCLVAVVHLKSDLRSAQRLSVVGKARDQAAGDALVPTLGVDGHVEHLEPVARKHATREAHNLAAVVRHPPGAPRLGELVLKHGSRPRLVHAARKGSAFQGLYLHNVVHRHGAQLRVDACQLLGHAGALHKTRLAQAQTLALGLLGVGQARVDGQHQGRIARVAHVIARTCRRRTQQSLRRGMPAGLIHEARKTRFLELRAILLQAIAGKHDGGRVRAKLSRPCIHAGLRLHHGLGDERAHGTLVAHLVDTRVDLAAHGVTHHAHHAARTGRPGSPGRGVERGGSVQGFAKTAAQALRRGNANAYAGERAGSAPYQHLVHVRHGQVRLGQAVKRRGSELDVGLAAAEVVAAGKHAHAGCAVFARGPLRNGTAEHVGRSVERKHDARVGRAGILRVHEARPSHSAA